MKKTVLLLMLSLAILGVSISGTAVAGDKLELGALYPISGSLALLGEESWRGAEIARLQRNKAGGIAARKSFTYRVMQVLLPRHAPKPNG